MSVPSTAPLYGDGAFVPEFAIREALINGFAELRNSRAQLIEFVSRFDNLPQGSQQEWNAQCMEAIEQVLDPESDNSLRNISLGYPTQDAALPWVGIVLESDSEDTGGATIGDNLVTIYQPIGDPVTNPDGYELVKHKVKGTDYTATISVSVWSTSPEMSFVLHEAIFYILFGLKGSLSASGIREVGFSSSSLDISSALEPRTGFVPLTKCVISYQRRRTVTSDPVPTRMSHRFIYRTQ